MSRISLLTDLYLTLNIFLKIRKNLLRTKKDFLCEDFFKCELNAIDSEIAKLRYQINCLH